MKLWQGDFVAARELFMRGIGVLPDLSKAMPGSEHTLTLARQLAYFHDLIGLSYYDEKNYAKARPEFEEAISIDPKLTSSIKKLADIAYQTGDKQKAIAYNIKGFEVEPENALWPLGLALIYKEENNMSAARRYAQQGLALDPGNAQLQALVKELK
jgi:tetratricopeptide (TPR) repeat protein